MPLAKALSIPNGNRDFYAAENTELVIDAFPRCANSYTEAVIRYHGFERRAVGHHTHNPSQIRYAAKRGIPTLTIVRRPEDACRSLVRYGGGRLDMNRALLLYADYHEKVLPYLDKVVVANFDRVTTDLASVSDEFERFYGFPVCASNFDPNDQGFVRFYEQLRERRSLEKKRRVSARLFGQPVKGRPRTVARYGQKPADSSVKRAVEVYNSARAFADRR